MAYVWIAIWVTEFPGIQIILLNICNLAMQLYLGNNPMSYKQLNHRETVNNLFIIANTFIYMTFSEWGPNEEAKYLMGWVLLATMSV